MAVTLRTSVILGLAVLVVASAAPRAHAWSYCSICEDLAGALEKDGTKYACDAIGCTVPPLSTVCDYLVDHLSDWILKHIARGYNATTMCRQIGMCSSEGCPCGECQSPQYHLRCLSLPNKCPSLSTTATVPGATPDAPALDALPEQTRTALRGFLEAVRKQQGGQALQGHPLVAATANPDEFCFDGDCDSSHNGCCLTCF